MIYKDYLSHRERRLQDGEFFVVQTNFDVQEGIDPPARDNNRYRTAVRLLENIGAAGLNSTLLDSAVLSIPPVNAPDTVFSTVKDPQRGILSFHLD